jgi:hypothetical protein
MVGEWIPIVAIIMSFGMVIAVVVTALYYDYRKRYLQNKEIIAAIEKGIDVPLPKVERRERDYRRLGIIWTLVGIAFTIAIWVSSHTIEGAIWGLLPVALGIAFLSIAFFSKKDDQNGNNS